MSITLQRYSPERKAQWDAAVRRTRQSSFLFERDFMDYHKDRFQDISLMVFDTHEQVIALLPASLSRSNAHVVESHGGLTYGGFLLMPSATASVVGEIFSTVLSYYQSLGITEIKYKPVPYIYCTYPAEEDLYWLFRHGATLDARTISSVIDLQKPYPLSTLRKRKVKKTEKLYDFRLCDTSEELPAFWQMLHDVLNARHATEPVHTVSELQLLSSRFPRQIRLLTVYASPKHPEDPSELTRPTEMVAGCLLFVTSQVVHVQYIAASDEGCRICALDWLFHTLITTLQKQTPLVPYLDFGISTEQGGQLLNEGLIFQKEGFGGRAVCYDTYKIVL